jgi:hypothetical protein
MAWIESHQEIPNHPKTLRLMNLMRWNNDTAVSKLHKLWWWCMDYAPDGDLRRHDKPQLAAAVGVSRSKAEQFVEAMIRAGWIDMQPYFRVHDWWDYAGPFLQTKYKRHPEVWQRVRDLYKGGCSIGTNADDAMHNERENLQTQGDCAVPPNQPNQTNQTDHHHHQTSAAAAADDQAEPQGQQQRQSTRTHPYVQGTLADSVNPGIDIEKFIHDRIGDNAPLSRLDLEKLITLKNRHGSKFYIACDRLHGGVTSVAAFLTGILEPEDKVAKMAAKLKEFMQAESTRSSAKSGLSHGGI